MAERDFRWINSCGNESSIFYRLILPSIIHDKKLSIPGKFVKKLGSDLSSVASLTTPNGHVWSVRLQNINNKVWFTQGWHEFIEHHSIRVGYLLVFTYNGSSNFSVGIFDVASSEIKYERGNQFSVSNKGGAGEGLKYERNYSVGSNSFNLEYHKTGQSTRDIGVQCNLSDYTTPVYETKVPKKRKHGSETSKYGSEILSPESEPSSRNFLRKGRVITPEEKEKVLNASKAFESGNPFCRVFLRRSYVYKGIGLHMPSSFSEKYLGSVTGFVTLQSSSGDKWPVRCMWRDGSAKLSKGWLEFVRDNNLEEGDVCIFELIKMGDAVLKVTIFRLSQEVPPLNQFPKQNLNRTPHTSQLAFAYDINSRNL